jgi:uncharacterized flavoprotein (TIGR03862 family)
MSEQHAQPLVAVLGAGPAGLMAAEVAAQGGAQVVVLDRMPSPARKLLIAGRGGLNLTHSEPLAAFLGRYGAAQARLAPFIEAFPPAALTAWAEALGQPTFIGSSGRVFPRTMKASPLLRAWIGRLGALGVTLRSRHRWLGWEDGALAFKAPEGRVLLRPAATVLALGGASWPRLGSDGAWAGLLEGVAPLRPANCGFHIAWSEHFRSRFAGAPLKRIALSFDGTTVRGEAVVTAAGIEGGAVYALSGPLREAIAAGGPATLLLDLRPDIEAAALAARLDGPRGGMSLANHLRRAGLPPVAIGLVQEALHAGATAPLSRLVKALPLTLTAPMGLDRAISSAGGLGWEELDERLMLRRRPGTFASGEMLDWEAPTGGYLLQACFSTGIAAGRAALDWARGQPGG